MRRIGIVGALALLPVAAAPVLAPRTALADHTGAYAVCPDPVPEGNPARMGIRHSGHKVLQATVTTDHDFYTAEVDDYTQYDAETFTQSEGRTLWIPIETTEDARPEQDETFAIAFWDDDRWHGCVVTILDDDMPRIVDVDLISNPIDGWAYRTGDAVDVAVKLDQKVEVEGSPSLALFLGEGDAIAWRGADYLQGSGSFELLFRYVVQPGDLDPDGLSVGAAATADDRTPAYGFSGTINAAGTDAPIDYTHPGVSPFWQQRVDGRPYVQSTRIISTPQAGRQTYRANEIIEVAFTFDTRMVVEGDVCVTLYLGYDGRSAEGTDREAGYLLGSGTDTLVFGYTVRPGDMDPRGIMVAMGTDATGFCGSGTVKGLGTDVERNPWYLGKGPQSNHRVDTDPPAASSVAIMSQPADGEAYAEGETISVEIAFSETVTISGSPYLRLDIGGVARHATLADDRDSGSSVLFEYEVQPGDTDTDGVGIDANSLRPNDGGFHDAAGNAAELDHDVVPADATQRVAA